MKDFEKDAGPAEHDLDAASEASSEPDYNYEFAQMEVIMKTLNSNGKMRSPAAADLTPMGPQWTSKVFPKFRHIKPIIYSRAQQQGAASRQLRELG